MNLFISFAVILLFLVGIVKQAFHLRKLQIPTKKTLSEIIVYIIGILVVAVITLLYGKQLIHYLIGTLGIVLFTIEFLKQGIFDNGILIAARGKEVSTWDEIAKVHIIKGKDIKVTYLCKDGLSITHKFNIKKYEKIVALIIKNHINYDITYK